MIYILIFLLFTIDAHNAHAGRLDSSGAGGSVSDTAYGAAWDGDTTVAPSKNAVYDKIETIASGGDNVSVNSSGATNANFLDNLYVDWAINTASTPDDITSKFNYAETLAGNPALLTTECVFTADGLLCEGTTADAIEMKLAFPDPATTDKTLTLPNATDTLVGKDTTDTLTNKTMTAAANVIDADTSVALAADPTDCGAGTVATAIAASGNLTCGITPIVSANIDTTAELETIQGGVNILLETEIDASSELAAIMDDETGNDGSSLLVFNDNPSLTGLTLTAEGFVDALGLEFEPGDALTDCSTFAATGGGIFYDDSEGKFKKCQDNTLTDMDTGGSGAPTTVDYLVGTADGTLSAEIVVGTSPGGELGGTWASPTLDDSVTVTGWVMGASTATTPSADDNDTSLATTAYVQTEINAMGGRSLTASSGSMDADAELYTWTLDKTIETPTSADNFIIQSYVPLASTITKINCHSEDATSVTIRIDECDSAGDNCAGVDGATTIVCDVDGQADDGSLSNTAIDVGDTLRAVVTATSGTPGHVAVTVMGTRDD